MGPAGHCGGLFSTLTSTEPGQKTLTGCCNYSFLSVFPSLQFVNKLGLLFSRLLRNVERVVYENNYQGSQWSLSCISISNLSFVFLYFRANSCLEDRNITVRDLRQSLACSELPEISTVYRPLC